MMQNREGQIYYITWCCPAWGRDRQRAAAETRDFQSLNDLLFEVDNVHEVGRVNVSEITHVFHSINDSKSPRCHPT